MISTLLHINKSHTETAFLFNNIATVENKIHWIELWPNKLYNWGHPQIAYMHKSKCRAKYISYLKISHYLSRNTNKILWSVQLPCWFAHFPINPYLQENRCKIECLFKFWSITCKSLRQSVTCKNALHFCWMSIFRDYITAGNGNIFP